jgi:hypothetical protein
VFELGFFDLYPTIVWIFVSSVGSIVVNSKGAFDAQSAEYQ